MKDTFRFSVCLFFMLSICDASAWTLVYENDATGKTTYGSLATLVNLIKQGYDVKIQQQISGLYANGTCDGVYVNVDNSVTCTLLRGISIRNTLPGPDFGFQDDAYNAFAMVNTKGQMDMIRFSVGEHIDRGRTEDTTRIKWFVN